MTRPDQDHAGQARRPAGGGRAMDSDERAARGAAVPPPGAFGRAAAILVAVFSIVYALTAIFRHRHFDSSIDLGIFDQAVWHMSRLDAPASSLRGFSNLFGDHFHPAIAAFVPLYWIAPGAATLIVGQAVLFAASIVPVLAFLRSRLPWPAAVWMTIAYGLFWGLQRAANFDVHEMAFAPLCIAGALLALDRRRWTAVWLWCGALSLVKEDLIPLVTMIGLYAAAGGERRQGLLLAATSLAWFFVVLRAVIPAFGEGAGYNYLASYGEALRQPWTIPGVLLSPPEKLETLLMWLAPFAFLPLRSPLVVLLAPLVLERFLSTNSHHWGTSFHYSAPFAPILAMSAGDGLARFAGYRPGAGRRPAGRHDPVPVRPRTTRHRLALVGAVVCAILSSLLPGRQPHWRLLTPAHYRERAFEDTGREVLARIPRDASIVAQTALVPHLSQRRTIYMLDAGSPDTEFLVTSVHVGPWPLESHDQIAAIIADRRRRGYETWLDRDGWMVLRRPTRPGSALLPRSTPESRQQP
jgi:uncharacterized membrane protein